MSTESREQATVTIEGHSYTLKKGDVFLMIGKDVLINYVLAGTVNMPLVKIEGDALSVHSIGGVDVKGDVSGDIKTTGSVSVTGSVAGDIKTTGGVSCGNVTGSVNTQGSVRVAGNCGPIKTMGSVEVKGDVSGRIDTMGRVTVGSRS